MCATKNHFSAFLCSKKFGWFYRLLFKNWRMRCYDGGTGGDDMSNLQAWRHQADSNLACGPPVQEVSRKRQVGPNSWTLGIQSFAEIILWGEQKEALICGCDWTPKPTLTMDMISCRFSVETISNLAPIFLVSTWKMGGFHSESHCQC